MGAAAAVKWVLPAGRTSFFAWCCWLCLLTGCERVMPLPSRPSSKQLAIKARQEKLASQTLNDAECAALGRQIADWISSGQPDKINDVVDLDRLVEQAAAQTSLEGAEYRGLMQGMRQGLSNQGLWQQLAKQVERGGSTTFLRVINRGGHKRALFRVIMPDGAVNYYEMLLAPRHGAAAVVDVYVHALGERFTESLANTFNRQRRQRDKHADEALLRMIKHSSNQEYDAALADYESLPAEFQRSKQARVVYLIATAAVAPDKHPQAVAAFNQDFPDDPAADLLCIDGHILAGRFDEALAACERLDKAVGGDPYLRLLQGRIQLGAKRYSAAEQLAVGLAASGEFQFETEYLRGDIALAQEDYRALVRSLNRLKTEHGIDMREAVRDENFAGFRASPQYQQWLKQQQ